MASDGAMGFRDRVEAAAAKRDALTAELAEAEGAKRDRIAHELAAVREEIDDGRHRVALTVSAT